MNDPIVSHAERLRAADSSSQPKAALDYASARLQRPQFQLSVGARLAALSGTATAYIAYALEANPSKPVGFFFGGGLSLWIVVALVAASARKCDRKQNATLPAMHASLALWDCSAVHHFDRVGAAVDAKWAIVHPRNLAGKSDFRDRTQQYG